MNDQAQNADRAFQRRRVIKGGMIAFNLRRLTYPCVVRDLSVAGARLQTDTPGNIPDTFDLLIELDGFEAECEVMWREGKQVGVRFLAEPRTTAPKRKQVVISSDQAPVMSVRLADRKRQYEPKDAARDDAVAFKPLYEPEPDATPEPRAQGPDQETSSDPNTLNRHAAFQQPIAEEGRGALEQLDESSGSPIVIVLRDPGARALFEAGFQQRNQHLPHEFVSDGQELVHYLANQGAFFGKPRPGMILLDFDDAYDDSLAVLRDIKTGPRYNSIPIVAMTRSNADEDIEHTLEFGVGSYVQKPQNVDDMADIIKTLARFWTNFVAHSEETGMKEMVG